MSHSIFSFYSFASLSASHSFLFSFAFIATIYISKIIRWMKNERATERETLCITSMKNLLVIFITLINLMKISSDEKDENQLKRNL